MSARVSHTIAIRFRDIDSYGHVNNAVYLNYFEQCRMAWFRERIGKAWDWKKDGIILVKNEVEYLHPVKLSDTLVGEAWVEHVGNTSFVMAYELSVGEQREQVTRGRSTIVCFDFQTNCKQAVPEVWRQAMG